MGTVSDVTAEFGTLTTGGTGGYRVIPDSSAITSIVPVGPIANFQVSGTDIIEQTVGHTFTTQVDLTFTVNFADATNDNFTLTAQPFTGYTVRDISEFQVVGQSTALAYTDIIGLRNGEYNTAQSDVRITRTTEFVGTFNGTNHVEVRPCLNEVPEIHRLTISNSNDVRQAFRFNGVRFRRPFISGGAFEPALQFSSGGGINGRRFDSIVENCNITSEPGFTPGTSNIKSGIRISDGGTHFTFRDNVIDDVFNAINCQNASDLTITGNVMRRGRADAVFISGNGGNIIYHWNSVIDLRPTVDGQHLDNFQISPAGSIDNISIIGNNHLGTGTETNQGWFISNVPENDTITNLIMRHNRYVGGAITGMRLSRAVDAIIEGNTFAPSPDASPGLLVKMIFSNCVGTECRFNLSPNIDFTLSPAFNNPHDNTIVDFDITPHTDIFVANPAVNGQDITDTDAQLAIVTSSPPDLPTPKHGAHQDYVVYSTETSSTAAYPAIGDPTIGNATATADGSTGFTATLQTSESDGTAFVVATTSTTVPTEAQIPAGQDHTGAAAPGSDNEIVIAPGTLDFSASGLTAGTQYYTYFVHRNPALEFSNIASAPSFETVGAGSMTGVIDDGTAYLTRAGGLSNVDNTETQFSFVGIFNFADTASHTDYIYRFDDGANDSYLRRFQSNGFLQLRQYETPGNVQRNTILGTVIPQDEDIAIMVRYNSSSGMSIYVESASLGVINSTTAFADGNAATLSATNMWIFHSNGGSIFEGTTKGQRFIKGSDVDWSDSATRDLYYDNGTYELTDFSGTPGTAAFQFTGTASAYQAGTNEGDGGDFVATNPSGFSDSTPPSVPVSVEALATTSTDAAISKTALVSVEALANASASVSVTGGDQQQIVRRLSVSGVFSSSGTSEATIASRGTVFISGTFVGTVRVQAMTEAGNWVNALSVNSSGSESITFINDRPIRLDALLTSGVIEYSLEVANMYLEER